MTWNINKIEFTTLKKMKFEQIDCIVLRGRVFWAARTRLCEW